MESKLEFHILSEYANNSPFFKTSPSPKAIISSRIGTPFIQTTSLSKNIEQAALKKFRIKQVGKRLDNSNTQAPEDTFLKKAKKQKPRIEEKPTVYVKIHRRLKVPKPKNSIAEKSATSLNMAESVLLKGDTKSCFQSTSKVSSPPTNSQIFIPYQEPENQTSSESLLKNKQNRNSRFKKTMSSFWSKDDIPANSNNNSTVHSRCNSAAINPQAFLREITESTLLCQSGQDKNRMAPKKHQLSSSKIELNDRLRAESITPSVRSFLGGYQRFDKGIALSIEMGNTPEVVDMTRSDDFFYFNVNSILAKPNEGKYLDEEEINTKKDGGKHKDSTEHSFSINDQQPRNSPAFQLMPIQIEEEDHFLYENKSSRRTPKSQRDLSKLLGTPKSHHEIKKILKKKNEAVSSNYTSGSQTNKKATYIMSNISDLKTTSFRDNHSALSSPKNFENLDMKTKLTRNRFGNFSLTFDKRVKSLTEKNSFRPSPMWMRNHCQDLDDFEVEGWE